MGHYQLISVAIDCIWYGFSLATLDSLPISSLRRNVLTACQINESVFLAHEGVFALLDYLQASPYKLQNQILGALVDLSENESAVSHLRHWQSQKTPGVDFVRLLIQMWMKEQITLGVKIADDGVLDGESLHALQHACVS